MKKILYTNFILSLIFTLSLSFVHADSGVSTLDINVINQDPDPVIAGGIVELRLNIENLGSDDVTNLIIELDDSFPFSLIDSADSVRSFGSLSSFQGGDDAKIIKYSFQVNSQAVAGIYDVDIIYYDSVSPLIQSTISLPIEIQNLESAEISAISKSVFTPGQQDELTFTIRNVGSAPLNDLFFSFQAEDNVLLPVESGSAKYIKKLNIGEITEVSYAVVADSAANTGLYSLDLVLEFKNAITGSSEQMITTSGVYIGGETSFVTAFSQSQNGEYSFTIANVGTTQAGAVAVILPKQDSWKVLGTDTIMIGNLNTGDYTIASYQISPSGEELKSLSMIISYTDTMGVRREVFQELNIPRSAVSSIIGDIIPGSGTGKSGATSTTSSSSTNTSMIWGIVIGVVAVVLIGIIRKKILSKKKKNKFPRMK